MIITTFIYKMYIRSKGIHKIIWDFLRRLSIYLFNDPKCNFFIHGKKLSLPLSHDLPYYYRKYEMYDRLPMRISYYIRNKYNYLKCIDVGANIGDTIIAFNSNKSDKFIAIEPNPKFYLYLKENLKDINVIFLNVLCSFDNNNNETFMINEKRGTSSFLKDSQGIQVHRMSLDEILRKQEDFNDFNVLKIDTDGYDFDVLKGAREAIKNSHPVILFECDIFNNDKYFENCLEAFDYFKSAGYTQYLLYDNYGYLMGKYSLSDISFLKDIFFYQLTSNFNYFDILIMNNKDIFDFYKEETNFFISNTQNNFIKKVLLKNYQHFFTIE